MQKTKKLVNILTLLLMLCISSAQAGNGYDLLPKYVTFEQQPHSTPIAKNGVCAPIYLDGADWKGVQRAAADLAADFERVTSVKAEVTPCHTVSGLVTTKGQALTGTRKGIIIGTIGKSKLIDELIRLKKLNVKGIKGAWESFIIETIDGNVVIAGSDKRGTIYGIYDLSEKMGVSPWYWWADAPVTKQKEIYITNGRYVMPSPKVK